MGSWQEALLTTEEVEYVGEGLVQLLGSQRLATSGRGSLMDHPQACVGGVTYTVEEGVLPKGSQ